MNSLKLTYIVSNFLIYLGLTVCSLFQAISDELGKERAAREALKDVVSAAESMLRVARARIAILERQLKENKSELDAARRKHKDLEQLVKLPDDT